MAILEAHVYEELFNIVQNAPLFPGDTISHQTADECVRRKWAQRDIDGNLIPTSGGKQALEEWMDGGSDDKR